MRRAFLCLMLLSAVSGVSAAPDSLRVDKKGVLNVPAAMLKKLKVKTASNGMVCVQFPKPPVPRELKGHEELMPDRPPRIFPSIRQDGSLKIPRQRLVPGADFAPGPPGTVYTATSEDGRLVLAVAKKKK